MYGIGGEIDPELNAAEQRIQIYARKCSPDSFLTKLQKKFIGGRIAFSTIGATGYPVLNKRTLICVSYLHILYKHELKMYQRLKLKM